MTAIPYRTLTYIWDVDTSSSPRQISNTVIAVKKWLLIATTIMTEMIKIEKKMFFTIKVLSEMT
ncbi:hypothetical protein DPMN_118218 [Dreissena polymorpha]|uniref:Uncharacterized protein n=1 Tax=Dreissena polymorpha TaxID=45954 RepID=A0A9D4JQW5_DREPO|nr:hypothetical protein DPMN_118218 [Dreissena polymorpha]